MFDFTYDNNKFSINENEFITLVGIFISNEGSKYSDKIINDLSRSLGRQIVLEDKQRKTLNMVSKALPVLKRIKEVSDLERVAREVNKKQKTTIGQITN